MDSSLLPNRPLNIGITVEAMTGALAAGQRRLEMIGVLVVATESINHVSLEKCIISLPISTFTELCKNLQWELGDVGDILTFM